MYNEQYNKCVEKLSDETMQVLTDYYWPGNVRELENMIKRMVVLGESTVLQEIAQREPMSTSAFGAAGDDDELISPPLGRTPPMAAGSTSRPSLSVRRRSPRRR